MHGVGAYSDGAPTPGTVLTAGWMTAQWKLQKKILARMRALGIVPILPAFQGNVPVVMRKLFPSANISVQGGGRHYAAWLDGTDPLFGKIADEYMRTMCLDFGCHEHWYEADGYFAAGRPPWLLQAGLRTRGRHRKHHEHAIAAGTSFDGLASDCCCHATECSQPSKPVCCECCPSTPIDPAVAANAKVHATAAFAGMTRTDPDAVWYYQGWILGGQFSYIKGLTEAVPRGRLVISDMWCEGGGGIWKSNGAFSFFGAPFVWGVLHNFGGNVGLWGDVSSLNSGPFDAYANASSVAGVGIFPEGIDQNSAYYTLLFDVAWEHSPVNLESWWRRYAIERYGRVDDRAVAAWLLLGKSVYGSNQEPKSMYGEKARDGITSYMWSGDEEAVQPYWYDLGSVYKAWGLLVELGAEWGPDPLPETLRYDIVNTGREYLAKLSNPMFLSLANATTPPTVAAAGAKLGKLAAWLDKLLCSDWGFTAGWWIAGAVDLGATTGEKRWLEWAARAQPTTWLPACNPTALLSPSGNASDQVTGICGTRSDLADYSNKQWGGLISGFYSPRQQCYVKIVARRGLPVRSGDVDYNKCLDQVAWDFQHDFGGRKTDMCGPAPLGDPVALSQTLLALYPHHPTNRSGTALPTT